MTMLRAAASISPMMAVCCTIIVLFHLTLVQSFFYGFDLTDQAYYLYNLMYPRNGAAFSGFAWAFSSIGALFGHHVVFYRVLSLVLGALAVLHLVSAVAALLRNRLSLALPMPLAAGFAVTLAGLHQALLPDFSYNNGMTIGVTLVAGGFVNVLSGHLLSRQQPWHAAVVTTGVVLAIFSRTLSGIGLVIGVVGLATPAAWSIGLIGRWRDARWYVLAVLCGIPLAALTAFVVGNPRGLYATQRLMMEAGGGTGQYLDTFVLGWYSLRDYAAGRAAGLIAAIALASILFRQTGGMGGVAVGVPLMLAMVYLFAKQSGQWNKIASSYHLAGLLAGAVFVASLVSNRHTAADRRRLTTAVVLVLMLVLLPVIACIGTSNDIIVQSVMSLGPLGVLLALPFSRPLAAGVPSRGTPDQLRLEQGADVVGVVMLITIAATGLWLREHESYRVASPLSQRQTMMLTAPPQLRGVRVAADTHAHLEELAALARRENFDAAQTRVLSLYRSPGSVLATGMPALGPPWIFDHMADKDFNCRLIGQAVETAPARLIILQNSEPRPQMQDCLVSFGYGPRASWRPLGCVAPTTAEAGGISPRSAQTCVFETIRRPVELAR